MAAALTDNQKAWVAELRSGDKAQTKQSLKTVNQDDGSVSFCCLGVASEISDLCTESLDGITGVVWFNDINTGERVVTFPPPSVTHWLGVFSDLEYALSTDVYFDAPAEIAELPQQMHQSDQERYDMYPNWRPQIECVFSAAAMNDSGFTFDQIADMIEYFGVKVMR